MMPSGVLDFLGFVICLAGVFVLGGIIRSFTREQDPEYQEAMLIWNVLEKKIDGYLAEKITPASEWEELKEVALFADEWIEHRTGKKPCLVTRIDNIKAVLRQIDSLR